MDSQRIQQPGDRLVAAAWRHAEQAARTAIAVEPSTDAIVQHCQAILAELPDWQQRQVINRLALARRRTRGTATDPAAPAIPGTATDPEPAGPTLGTLAPAIDAAEYRVRERVAAPWDQD